MAEVISVLVDGHKPVTRREPIEVSPIEAAVNALLEGRELSPDERKHVIVTATQVSPSEWNVSVLIPNRSTTNVEELSIVVTTYGTVIPSE